MLMYHQQNTGHNHHTQQLLNILVEYVEYSEFCTVTRNSYCPPAGRSCMTQRQAEKIFSR